jgi:hypothetical protein
LSGLLPAIEGCGEAGRTCPSHTGIIARLFYKLKVAALKIPLNSPRMSRINRSIQKIGESVSSEIDGQIGRYPGNSAVDFFWLARIS